MNVYVPPISLESTPWGAERVRQFRIIPRLEAYPAVVSFAQTVAGKLVLLTLFGAGMTYFVKDWLVLSLCLALITFIPSRRRLLVTISTLIFTFAVPWRSFPLKSYTVSMIVLCIALGGMFFWSAVRFPRSWYGRRPVFVLLSSYSVLILAASSVPQDWTLWGPLWLFVHFFSIYVWFIAYSLLDHNAADRDPFKFQLGSYLPFWGSTTTPFAKGAAYLRRIEAKDGKQLAITQLKAVKLLSWALLLFWFGHWFDYCIYQYLRIPPFQTALALSVQRTPLPWYVCWASLIAGFFGGIISLCVTGHSIIAGCRMAGFNALRNTYRPLSSRTVAEFFNRYYFYFKELLVDFFFYPFFLRYFKKNRKVRLVAAIFAAACFGNAFFHFGRDLIFIERLGLIGALVNYQVYLFYCVVLATGISISQLRHRNPAPAGFIRGQLLPSALVVFFFCLLDVFGSTERNYPLSEHFRFLSHLFNLNL